MATTAKGITTVANTDPMQGPAQISQVATDVDNLLTNSVASASNLSAISAANSWFGRRVIARDTNVAYRYTGSGWEAETLFYTAGPVANTLPSSGGTLGCTSGISVPASAFPRLVKVTLSQLALTATGTVDFTIQQDGTNSPRRARVTGNLSGTCRYEFTLPANTATSFQGVGVSTAAASWGADPTLGYLSATVQYL